MRGRKYKLEKFVIDGGVPLIGEVRISGAKNAAVAVIPAAIMADGICVINNLPRIKDVQNWANILKSMGIHVEFEENEMRIDGRTARPVEPPIELVQQMRASYYLVGAMLGRFKKAVVGMPGGCSIGVRPIDQHIKGFEALGAKINIEHGVIMAEAERLVGTNIFLDVVSVGATINIMLAASMAEGVTMIENAAKEPHVVDVANFLNAMGADIKGAGTDNIRIRGVKKLSGCYHTIIPDQIEAGTFMIAAAATGGDITITNVIPTHLDSIIAKLEETGTLIIPSEDSIRVIGKRPLKSTDIRTQPYPGFPTDLQQPMAVLLSVVDGTSMITENVWDNRFKYIDELKKMGLKAKVEGRSAIIEGVKNLTGAKVSATDLRAGAAMVLAGLVAHGRTEVIDIEHIDRGYEFLEEKLKNLGAKIKRVKE